MPLETGHSKEAFSHNVAELMNNGHPQKQALAIAYKEKEGRDAVHGTIKAAGVMYVYNNEILLVKRLDGSWAFPGGKIEMGESPLDAALRESSEEVGYKPDRESVWQFDYSNNGRVQFTTFVCHSHFDPILDTREHSEFMWCAFGELPDIMHPNAKATIDRYTKTYCGYGLDSAREVDPNGWIEVKDNPISKVGVFPYLGRNISADLDPDKTYMVLRPAEELSRPETVNSFKLVPWIDEHVMLGKSASGLTNPKHKGIEGVIGEQVRFDEVTGRLVANIKVFSDDLEDLIEGGKRELSAGYRCKYEISSGIWNGQRYDAIQRNIRGNHLALVKEGRMGPDVAVLDHRFEFTFDARDITMPEEKEKNGQTGMDAVNSALKEMKDSMEEMKKSMDERLSAMDKKFGKDAKGKDNADPAVDPAIAADKRAKDEKDEEEKKAEDKKAMDAAITTAMDAALKPVLAAITALQANGTKTVLTEVRQRDNLARTLADHGVAMDSVDTMTLPELQKAAVTKLGLKAAEGQEQVALDGYFHNRQLPGNEIGFVAMDSASKTEGGANAAAEFFNKPAA